MSFLGTYFIAVICSIWSSSSISRHSQAAKHLCSCLFLWCSPVVALCPIPSSFIHLVGPGSMDMSSRTSLYVCFLRTTFCKCSRLSYKVQMVEYDLEVMFFGSLILLILFSLERNKALCRKWKTSILDYECWGSYKRYRIRGRTIIMTGKCEIWRLRSSFNLSMVMKTLCRKENIFTMNKQMQGYSGALFFNVLCHTSLLNCLAVWLIDLVNGWTVPICACLAICSCSSPRGKSLLENLLKTLLEIRSINLQQKRKKKQ